VEAVFSFLPEVPQVLHERASHGKPGRRVCGAIAGSSWGQSARL
jgi:hypothetical protein